MALQTPIIMVNFKTYPRGTGERAVETAKICEQVAAEEGVAIAICVQATDLKAVASAVSIPVLAQHMDPDEQGQHTGSIVAEALKDAGAAGTLLNHSEKRLAKDVLAASVKRAKDAGLLTVVCVATAQEAGEAAALGPDMIAIEPPELIGGDISVSSAQPEIVTDSVKNVDGKAPVLCGAGVKSGEDVARALELGTVGALLASGVMVKTDDPASVLREMARAIKGQ